MVVIKRNLAKFGLLVCALCFTSKEVLAQGPDEEVEALLLACRYSQAKYELGVALRKGTCVLHDGTVAFPGHNNPDRLRWALRCFEEGAQAGNPEALHNIGSVLDKLDLSLAAYPFFSIAAHKGLGPSKNNQSSLKKTGFKLSPDKSAIPLLRAPLESYFVPEVAAMLFQIVEDHGFFANMHKFLPSEKKLKALDGFVLRHPHPQFVAKREEAYKALYPGVDRKRVEKIYFEEAYQYGHAIQALTRWLEPFRTCWPPEEPETTTKLKFLEAGLVVYVQNFYLRLYDTLKTIGAFQNKREGFNQYQTHAQPPLKILQRVCVRILDVLAHYGRIDPAHTYGILQESSTIPSEADNKYLLAYIKEEEGGIFPFVVPEKRPEICITTLLYLTANYQQRAALFDAHGFITEPGLTLFRGHGWSPGTSSALVANCYTGTHIKEAPFQIGPCPQKLKSNTLASDPLGRSVLSVFSPDAIQELKEKKKDLLFFPFTPIAEEDRPIFDVLALEDLIEAQKNETHPHHQIALTYIAALEKEEQMTIKDILEQREQIILSMYEQEILAEQANITQKVIEDAIPGRLQKPKSALLPESRPKSSARKVHLPGGSPSSSTSSSSSSSTSFSLAEEAKKRFQNYKREGRIKYRVALSTLNKILHDHAGARSLKTSIAGSHITYHGDGGRSATSVIDHGSKDRTMPAAYFNQFVQELMKLISRQEKQHMPSINKKCNENRKG